MARHPLEDHLNRARKRINEDALIAQSDPGAGALGGPLVLPDMGPADMGPMMGPLSERSKPPLPMRVGAGYRNMYGTDFNVGYDPVLQSADAKVQFPIGAAEQGLQFQGSVRYNPESGASGQVGFSKRFLPEDPAEARRALGIVPGVEKFGYGLTFNEPPPGMGPGMPGPMNPGLPPGMDPRGMPGYGDPGPSQRDPGDYYQTSRKRQYPY